MGTSASSNGPGSGVPFDPPWLEEIMPILPGEERQPIDPGSGDENEQDNEQSDKTPLTPTEVPDTRRHGAFGNARRSLGNFARTGDQDAFRIAMGHYSRTGMGGASKVAKRMRVSTRSASNLFNVLQAAREGTDPKISEWVTSLTARSADAQEIIDEIIRYVAPNGGNIDEVSCQVSMAQAIQDLLEENPNVDLLSLDDGNIWRLIEFFLGYEASSRICLDIGKVFENPDISPRDRVLRMNEMQDYLKAELSVQIEELRQQTPNAACE